MTSAITDARYRPETNIHIFDVLMWRNKINELRGHQDSSEWHPPTPCTSATSRPLSSVSEEAPLNAAPRGPNLGRGGGDDGRRWSDGASPSPTRGFLTSLGGASPWPLSANGKSENYIPYLDIGLDLYLYTYICAFGVMAPDRHVDLGQQAGVQHQSALHVTRIHPLDCADLVQGACGKER